MYFLQRYPYGYYISIGRYPKVPCFLDAKKDYSKVDRSRASTVKIGVDARLSTSYTMGEGYVAWIILLTYDTSLEITGMKAKGGFYLMIVGMWDRYGMARWKEGKGYTNQSKGCWGYGDWVPWGG